MEDSDKVKITLQYFANVKDIMGEPETEIEVSTRIQDAIDDIRDYVASRGVTGLLYTIMINDVLYYQAIRDGAKIKEGDTLKMLPITLGG